MSIHADRPDARRQHEDAAAFARMVAWLLRLQAALIVAGALVALALAGAPGALAVVAGGGIGVVLTAAAALRTGVASGNAAATVAAFYRGMALKLALAVVLFVAVALWFAEWFVPVLAGYVITLAAYWVALFRVGRTGAVDERNDSNRLKSGNSQT